jgi:outer membrane protein assembly factor BamB
VYARGQDQRLRRLEPRTGDIDWITPLVFERLDTSEVVAVSDHVVVTLRSEEQSMVTVFDRETGQQLWRYDEREGSRLLRGVYASAAGGTVVITDFDRRRTKVFDDATGLPVMDLGPPTGEWVAIEGALLAFVTEDAGWYHLDVARRP